MATKWYYQVMGEEIGPLTSDQLKRLAQIGKVARDTLVRKGVAGDWIFAEHVRGLFGPVDDAAQQTPDESKRRNDEVGTYRSRDDMGTYYPGVGGETYDLADEPEVYDLPDDSETCDFPDKGETYALANEAETSPLAHDVDTDQWDYNPVTDDWGFDRQRDGLEEGAELHSFADKGDAYLSRAMANISAYAVEIKCTKLVYSDGTTDTYHVQRYDLGIECVNRRALHQFVCPGCGDTCTIQMTEPAAWDWHRSKFLIGAIAVAILAVLFWNWAAMSEDYIPPLIFGVLATLVALYLFYLALLVPLASVKGGKYQSATHTASLRTPRF
jgi:hypothetical protein